MVHHEFSEEGRKARFEQWEKYGADRLKNDLQTDPYRRVHRRRRRASSRRASRPKSSSQVTLCWRGATDQSIRQSCIQGRTGPGLADGRSGRYLYRERATARQSAGEPKYRGLEIS